MFINKLWLFGDQDVQVPAHLNFGKFILNRIRRVPGDRVALENVETGEKMTYKELAEYAVKLSVALTNLGVKKGDVVALGSERRVLFVPTALAVVLSGGSCTPFDVDTGRAHLEHKLQISQPTYFICSKLFWETNRVVLEKCKSIKTFLTLDDSLKSFTFLRSLICNLPDFDVNQFEPVAVKSQVDALFIMYSSGTTGMPKGVEVAHLTFIINCLGNDIKDESLEVVYITADWFHSYDLHSTFNALGLGKKIVYTNEVTLETVTKTFRKHKVNLAYLYPPMINWLTKMDERELHNIDSLKVVCCGGSALQKETLKKLKQRIPSIKEVLQCYGMTEVGELTSEARAAKGSRAGSVGGVAPGVTLKVVDVKTGETLGPNQHGEIYIKSFGFMKGYIGVDPSTYIVDEGFFRTGDLGYYDEDGYVYIMGRLKEIIIYDGYNVSPLELETILQLHPEVREAGVVGTPVPDYGELPTAFVVRQPGSTITEQQLHEFVNVEVAPHMQLRGGIKFIDKLPRSAIGKLSRRHLREMLKVM
ncbi:luciferin 4-monooxygenase-like [Pectinophora gossypiella]|uniref:luciferin 4-monooxygenase-like n=1 Tax=Pectinophora gossypiella TaxID=13191 RepID=UPI00214F2ED6|nr:luciferin 4-monooxygenase-like [Pectinophora gossypiella]